MKEVTIIKANGNSNQQLNKFNHEFHRQSNCVFKHVMGNNCLAEQMHEQNQFAKMQVIWP